MLIAVLEQKAVKSAHASKTPVDIWIDHSIDWLFSSLDRDQHYHPGFDMVFGRGSHRRDSGYHSDDILLSTDATPAGCARFDTHP